MTSLFVNCDWGTTHFRLRAVRADDLGIVAEFRSDEGVGRLAESPAGTQRRERFRAVLADGLGRLAGRLGASLASAEVVISGMASSSIGWHELEYAPLPFSLDGAGLVWRDLDPIVEGSCRHRILLVSGAATMGDVMRGEETQALGIFRLPLADDHRARSLVLMPGTHSKHLYVEGGEIRGFRTFMTGELFDVLGEHSILRHSVGQNGALDVGQEGEARTAFQSGIEHARSVPLSAALFRVRTRQLLDRLPQASNRAFLSGVLIGSELGYLADKEFGGQPLVLSAATPLVAFYRAALEGLGLAARLTTIGPADHDRLSALGQAVLLEKLGRI